MEKSIDLLDGQMLKTIVEKFYDAWKQKLTEQEDVMTFHDHEIKQAIELLIQNYEFIPWHQGIEAISRSFEPHVPRQNVMTFIAQIVNWYRGRFIDYQSRIAPGNGHMKTNNLAFLKNANRDYSFSMSQGRFNCLKWKDTLLFKTVYDLGIYQMLIWEMKPKTIIEIGSGSGGSAIWMSDLIDAYNLETKIFSFDINPPQMTYKHVEFMEGDCYKIEAYFATEKMKDLPHPILLIEDAHVNVLGVLDHFHPFLQSGDYLIVEDSMEKQEVIKQFMTGKEEQYKIDSDYCDYFGYNVSCCIDSIFYKV